MGPWKRIALMALCLGAGFALILALIVGGLLWYGARPRPPAGWNTEAVIAQFDRATTAGEDNHIAFEYVLENTTHQDYDLDEESSFVLMARLNKQEGLTQAESRLRLDLPVYIPAKQRVMVTIHLLKPYTFPGRLKNDPSEEERSRHDQEVGKYVMERISNLGGFSLFDRSRRYHIEFPPGWDINRF